MSKQLPTSYIVVTLLGLSVHGEFVPAETTLEVDRALRNDWIGSKLARDATDEEVAAYRAEQGDDGLDDLDEQRTALEAEIERLQDRKNELAGDLKALESDLEEFGKRRDALTAEVAELEKAKAAAAEPPATDAKAGKK
jgi:chromosome segregation ATPase